MSGNVRDTDFQPVQTVERVDEGEAAKRVIVRVRSLLERASRTRYVNEQERHWFAAPPLMPSLSEAVERAGRVVRTLGGGPPTSCRGEHGCGARIWFVELLTGRREPCNADGSSHFATCPRADRFRRERGRR